MSFCPLGSLPAEDGRMALWLPAEGRESETISSISEHVLVNSELRLYTCIALGL